LYYFCIYGYEVKVARLKLLGAAAGHSSRLYNNYKYYKFSIPITPMTAPPVTTVAAEKPPGGSAVTLTQRDPAPAAVPSQQEQLHHQLQKQLQQLQAQSPGLMPATTLSTKEFPKPPFRWDHQGQSVLLLFSRPPVRRHFNSHGSLSGYIFG
jgi:hypothetical protein